MAVKHARDVYTRRNEGVSDLGGRGAPHHRVVALGQGAALRALRDPRSTGTPTFFDIPDDVGAM
jgi:1,2-phenylacetyl-CoA epoxidase PaaB subunit